MCFNEYYKYRSEACVQCLVFSIYVCECCKALTGDTSACDKPVLSGRPGSSQMISSMMVMRMSMMMKLMTKGMRVVN